MLRTFKILVHPCALLAVVALSLPSQVWNRCHCCSGDDGARTAPDSTPVKSCCHADAATKSPTGNDANHHSNTPAPRGCPRDCPSPCCLVGPTTAASAPALTDFCVLVPTGLVVVPAAQQPTAPTLDGLLRPPRV